MLDQVDEIYKQELALTDSRIHNPHFHMQDLKRVVSINLHSLRTRTYMVLFPYLFPKWETEMAWAGGRTTRTPMSARGGVAHGPFHICRAPKFSSLTVMRSGAPRRGGRWGAAPRRRPSSAELFIETVIAFHWSLLIFQPEIMAACTLRLPPIHVLSLPRQYSF